MVMSSVVIDNQYRVGRNQLCMGGTNFRGVQIKRDISWSVLSIYGQLSICSSQCRLLLTPILSPLSFIEWVVMCHNLGESGGW